MDCPSSAAAPPLPAYAVFIALHAIIQRVMSLSPEIQRCASAFGRALALRHRDQEIAAPRHGDADAACRDTVGHLEIIAPSTAGHVGDTDHLARRERRQSAADQIEIGDAIDLVVIGDAAVAIAEADLGRT